MKVIESMQITVKDDYGDIVGSATFSDHVVTLDLPTAVSANQLLFVATELLNMAKIILGVEECKNESYK